MVVTPLLRCLQVAGRRSQLTDVRAMLPKFPPPAVDGDWAWQMLSLRRRGRGIRNPSRSFGLPADQECSSRSGKHFCCVCVQGVQGQRAWWPWAAPWLWWLV